MEKKTQTSKKTLSWGVLISWNIPHEELDHKGKQKSLGTQLQYILSQFLWSTVWFSSEPAQNLEEANHNVWKYLKLTNFSKFEYFFVLTKITMQNITTIGHPTTSDTLIISYVHFLHLCSNLLPVTSSRHVYILTFEWGFWNFQILGYSHLHADSLWQQTEMKIKSVIY